MVIRSRLIVLLVSFYLWVLYESLSAGLFPSLKNIQFTWLRFGVQISLEDTQIQIWDLYQCIYDIFQSCDVVMHQWDGPICRAPFSEARSLSMGSFWMEKKQKRGGQISDIKQILTVLKETAALRHIIK